MNSIDQEKRLPSGVESGDSVLSDLTPARTEGGVRVSAVYVAECSVRDHMAALSYSEVLRTAQLRADIADGRPAENPVPEKITQGATACREAQEQLGNAISRLAGKIRQAMKSRAETLDQEGLEACKQQVHKLWRKHCAPQSMDDPADPRSKGKRSSDDEPKLRIYPEDTDSQHAQGRPAKELIDEAAAEKRAALQKEVDDFVGTLLDEVKNRGADEQAEICIDFAEFLLDWNILEGEDREALEKCYRLLHKSLEQLRERLTVDLIERTRLDALRGKLEERSRSAERRENQSSGQDGENSGGAFSSSPSARGPETVPASLVQELRYAIVQRWNAEFTAGVRKQLLALTQLLAAYGEALRNEKREKNGLSIWPAASGDDQLDSAVAEAEAARGGQVSQSERLVLGSVHRNALLDRAGEVRDATHRYLTRKTRSNAA